MFNRLDFLILIENANRGEVENAYLLGNELKQRGYKVKYTYYHLPHKFFLSPKVVIVPNLYSDLEVLVYGKFFLKKEIKIVNLQYEQVLSLSAEKSKFYTVVENAKKAMHICWGEKTKQRLIKYGVSSDNVAVAGHISMDYYSEQLFKLFFSKQELEERYQIEKNSKWNLIISNFTYCDEQVVEDCKTRLEDDEWADEIADEMVRSKRILLQWLECCMEKYKNQIFIYRPHPAEKLDNNLKLLEKKYANFKYVADFSLKQWIKYADNVIVYYSTSIVDAFYNKKNSYIFRPFDLNPENDSVMMLEADYITSYEEFEEIFKNHDNWRYPIKIETVEDYYGKWNDGKAYYRIADICEKVYNEDIYYITLPLKGKSVIDWLKNIIFKIVLEINCFVPISKLVPKKHQFEFCIEYNQMKKYRVQRKIVHKFFDGK